MSFARTEIEKGFARRGAEGRVGREAGGWMVIWSVYKAAPPEKAKPLKQMRDVVTETALRLPVRRAKLLEASMSTCRSSATVHMDFMSRRRAAAASREASGLRGNVVKAGYEVERLEKVGIKTRFEWLGECARVG